MSAYQMSLAFRVKGISPGKKLVLLALADTADDQGRGLPSHKYIAKKADLSVHSVRAALRELTRLGLVEIIPRFREDGGRASNEYHLGLGLTAGR